MTQFILQPLIKRYFAFTTLTLLQSQHFPMKFAFSLIACFVVFAVQAQTSGKFSLEINYGLNANFFVGSYDEGGGPSNKTYLYNKDLLGIVGGIELKYHLNNHSSLFAKTSFTSSV